MITIQLHATRIWKRNLLKLLFISEYLRILVKRLFTIGNLARYIQITSAEIIFFVNKYKNIEIEINI